MSGASRSPDFDDSEFEEENGAQSARPNEDDDDLFEKKHWPTHFDPIDARDEAVVAAWFANPKNHNFKKWSGIKAGESYLMVELDAVIATLTQTKFRKLQMKARESITPYMNEVTNATATPGVKPISRAKQATYLTKHIAMLLQSMCAPPVQSYSSVWMSKFAAIYHRRTRGLWLSANNKAVRKQKKRVQAKKPIIITNDGATSQKTAPDEAVELIDSTIHAKRKSDPFDVGPARVKRTKANYQSTGFYDEESEIDDGAKSTTHKEQQKGKSEDTSRPRRTFSLFPISNIDEDATDPTPTPVKIAEKDAPPSSSKKPRPSWAGPNEPTSTPQPVVQTDPSLTTAGPSVIPNATSPPSTSNTQILNLLIEESEGYLNSNDPISEATFRTASLTEFFTRVNSHRANPSALVSRLKFSQRWGAKASFCINTSDGEESWRKVKADIRRNFSLQKEKKPGKKEFEVWVTGEGMGAVSEDEDDDNW